MTLGEELLQDQIDLLYQEVKELTNMVSNLKIELRKKDFEIEKYRIAYEKQLYD